VLMMPDQHALTIGEKRDQRAAAKRSC
jgi:hypothetical protein